MNVSTIVRVLLISTMLVAGATGCKRDPDFALDKLNGLREYTKEKGYDIEEKRAELALSKWQNSRLDSEPILLTGELGETTGKETKHLSFFAFDEDKDIVGIGIIEEYVDASGLSTTLTEEYETTGKGPYPPDEAVQAFSFVVQIRDAGQRKDVKKWNEYLSAKSGRSNTERDMAPTGETLPAMPTIWISIPEPNQVDIHIYIYDKQGHKSETIRARNLIGTQ